MLNQELYYYCSVLPVGISSPYFYLSDSGALPPGTRVEIPFGFENELRNGTVVNCARFSETDAPFPLAKTKHIRRILTEEEFLAENDGEEQDFFGQNNYTKDLNEVQKHISKLDFNSIYWWAVHHQECADSPAVIEKVLTCYKLCVSQKMPAAAQNLGTMYYKGRVVKQDLEKAAYYYEIAADAGLVCALRNLGDCYYYGRHQYVDYAKAYEYFLKGALLHSDVNCLYRLGDMYLNGYAVKQNPVYAFQLYQHASFLCEDEEDDYDSFCWPDIHLRMGKCLLKGIGTPVQLPEALTHLTNALCGFYKRIKTDQLAMERIDETKELIEETEVELELESDSDWEQIN